MTTHFPTFAALIETAVLPLKRQHPTWIRLDGQTSGGNRDAFATFRYQYKTWVVHADTRFDKLLIAWNHEIAGEKPFQVLKRTAATNVYGFLGRFPKRMVCIFTW